MTLIFHRYSHVPDKQYTEKSKSKGKLASARKLKRVKKKTSMDVDRDEKQKDEEDEDESTKRVGKGKGRQTDTKRLLRKRKSAAIIEDSDSEDDDDEFKLPVPNTNKEGVKKDRKLSKREKEREKILEAASALMAKKETAKYRKVKEEKGPSAKRKKSESTLIVPTRSSSRLASNSGTSTPDNASK